MGVLLAMALTISQASAKTYAPELASTDKSTPHVSLPAAIDAVPEFTINHHRDFAHRIHLAPLGAGSIFDGEVHWNLLVGDAKFLTGPDNPHGSRAGYVIDLYHGGNP